MLCKRHMGDVEPYLAQTLVLEKDATAIRLGFQQPSGIASRRSIPLKISKNIHAYAPRCLAQGIISADGEAYLQSWVDGTADRIPRPSKYSFLEHRQANLNDVKVPLAVWVKEPRMKVYNVKLVEAESDDDDDGNDDPSELVLEN